MMRAIWRRLPERVYRDVWLFIISIIVVIATIIAVDGSNKANDAVRAIQAGRRTSILINCAALSAVSDAGRKVILGAQHQPETPFMRFLERHGYPPPAVRERQAQAAAAAYVRSISNAIDARIGRKGDGLVKPDGTIDCSRLIIVIQASQPQGGR